MIVYLATFAILGLAVLAAAIAACFERQKHLLEDHICTLEAERDRARHEADVYRQILMPQYLRTERIMSASPGTHPDTDQSPTGQPAGSTVPSKADPVAASGKLTAVAVPHGLRRRPIRIPYRKFFNLMRGQGTPSPANSKEQSAHASS